MTVKELIAREEKKHAPKLIGDHIALQIRETNSSDEIYFEEDRIASGQCDYADLVDAKVSKYEYTKGYGYNTEIVDKLKIVIEVE